MLVLSRRVGESVVIGDNVVVTVLEVKGDVVRVGVDAPRDVAVHRRELLEELAETNRAAASPADSVVADLSRLASGRATPQASERETAPPPGSPPGPGDS